MKNSPLFRAVFDCMIYLQAASGIKNPANACIELVKNDVVELYLSKETIDEIEDVLTRPKFRNRFSALTNEMIQTFLDDIKAKAIIFRSVPSHFNYTRDPKDEKYINLAVKAEADFIVSRDKDLLDLMNDFSVEAKEFRQKFRPLKVVQPIEFLQIVQAADLSLKP
jgi:uncharacterized protein